MTIIHPNRWFFWTIAVLLGFGFLLVNQIFQALREFDEGTAELMISKNYAWKTFRSADLGISLKYPPTWQIEIEPQEGGMVTLQNPGDFNENVSLLAVDRKFENVIRQSLQIASEKKVVVDGIEGSWLGGGNPEDPATSNVVLVEAKGKLYYIAGQAKVFERIIAGIKFLPPLSSSSPRLRESEAGSYQGGE